MVEQICLAALKVTEGPPSRRPCFCQRRGCDYPTSYIWGVRYHVRAEEIHATLASLLATTGTDISSLLVENHSRRSHGRLVWWFSVSGTGALVDLLDGSWSTLGVNSSWILIKSLNEKQNLRRRAEKRASATPSSSRAPNSAPGGWDPAHRFNGHPRPRPPSGSQHGHYAPSNMAPQLHPGFPFLGNPPAAHSASQLSPSHNSFPLRVNYEVSYAPLSLVAAPAAAHLPPPATHSTSRLYPSHNSFPLRVNCEVSYAPLPSYTPTTPSSTPPYHNRSPHILPCHIFLLQHFAPLWSFNPRECLYLSNLLKLCTHLSSTLSPPPFNHPRCPYTATLSNVPCTFP